jgi:hypothetical protein
MTRIRVPIALKQTALALIAGAVAAWQAQAATVALNFADGWSAIWLSGKTAYGFSGWVDSTTTANNTANIAPSGTTYLGDNLITATWNSANTWAAGNQNTPDQMVYRVYLDDGDGGTSLVAGDGIGVSVTLSGLGSWLATSGAQRYVVRCFVSTDTSPTMTFQPFSLRAGAPDPANGTTQLTALPVLETVTMPRLGGADYPPNTASTSTSRGYADSGARTEDTITLTIPTRSGSARGTLGAIMVFTAEPSITTQPQAPAGDVPTGTAFMLSVGAAGAPPLAYQWYQGTTARAGATSSSFAVASATLADSGSYTVVVTNAYGAVTSAPVTVTVVQASPKITAQPASATRYAVGGYVTFSPSVEGTPPFTYQWKKDGGDVPNGTSRQLTLNNLTTGQAGSYQLYVTNVYGWTNTDVATLTIRAVTAGSYEEAIVTNKPVSYWRYSEQDVNPPTAFDYVGGRDMVNTAVTSVDGLIPPAYPGLESTNKAASYDGVTSGSETAGPLMNAMPKFTMCGWFNMNSMPQPTRTALFGQNDYAEFGFHGASPNAQLAIWCGGAAGDPYVAYPQTASMEAGKWYFVACIADGSTLSLFLNGNYVGQTSGVVSNKYNSTSPFRSGFATLDSTGNYFSGLIDEVALFDRALTGAELNSIYARAAGAVPPFITREPASQTLYVGRTATFTVQASGTLPFTYKWKKGTQVLTDTGNLSGTTTDKLTVANVAAADAGDYTVEISNSAGGITSAIATLTVIPLASLDRFSTAVGTLNPLGYWQLNEDVGPTAYDYFGGLNATYGIAAIPGQFGPRSPEFFGFSTTNLATWTYGAADSWIALPPFNFTTNTVTITAWVMPEGDQGGWRGLVYTRDGGAAGLSYGDTNELRYTWNGNDANTYNFASGLMVPTNLWSFIGLVIEPQQATLYLGTPTTGLKSAVNPVANTTMPFSGITYVGQDSQGDRFFNGYVDDVAFFNRSLSLTEMQNLYAQGSGVAVLTIAPTPAGALLSWPVGTLQVADEADGTYADLPAATSPFAVSAEAARKFYRVKNQ